MKPEDSFKGWNKLTIDQIDDVATPALLGLGIDYKRKRDGNGLRYIIKGLGCWVLGPTGGELQFDDDDSGGLMRVADRIKAAVDNAYLVGQWLEPPLNKWQKPTTKKRVRRKSPEVLAEVKKMLTDYVGGDDLATVTKRYGKDARTMRKYMPAVLDGLKPTERRRWTKALESIGEKFTAP